MAILIGLILVAIGISLAVNQWAAFVVTLQALIALGLLFWGGVAVLIGYSEMKARREYDQAVQGDSDQPKAQKPNDAHSTEAACLGTDAPAPAGNSSKASPS